MHHNVTIQIIYYKSKQFIGQYIKCCAIKQSMRMMP